MNSKRIVPITLVLILSGTYYLILYRLINEHPILDFTSFYSAILTLANMQNPYQALSSSFLPVTQKLSTNLNPPIVFWLFKPLANFSYQTATFHAYLSVNIILSSP